MPYSSNRSFEDQIPLSYEEEMEIVSYFANKPHPNMYEHCMKLGDDLFDKYSENDNILECCIKELDDNYNYNYEHRECIISRIEERIKYGWVEW